MIDLSGKTALVTGGSRGIGKAIVLRLARQGADVAFSYRGNADAAFATDRAGIGEGDAGEHARLLPCDGSQQGGRSDRRPQ